MNELIRQNIGELVSTLNTLLVEGIDIARDGLPILLEQILQNGKTTTILRLAVAIIVLIVSIIFFISILKKEKKNGFLEEWQEWVFAFSAVLGVISIATIYIMVETLIKIINSPLLYLVNKLRWYM